MNENNKLQKFQDIFFHYLSMYIRRNWNERIIHFLRIFILGNVVIFCSMEKKKLGTSRTILKVIINVFGIICIAKFPQTFFCVLKHAKFTNMSLTLFHCLQTRLFGETVIYCTNLKLQFLALIYIFKSVTHS